MRQLNHIAIDHVSKQYKSAPVKSLDDIHLTLSGQKTTGILGPNGAGKTTLISIVCGLLDESEGDVSYLCNDSSTLDKKELKQRLGFVPQDFAFYDELTALQNLEFFGALYNIPKKELKERSMKLLDAVGLSEFGKRRVREFSGGMKRRLNLILGLIHEPEILFLDEPTVGVDVQSRRAILRYLDQLKQKGITIIYTSHHLREAQDFCDEFVLIDHGKVLAHSKLDELLTDHEATDLEDIFLKLTGEELRDRYV